MNLKLVIKNENVTWEGKWVYLGESFSTLSNLEKIYEKKNRISLKKYKTQVFKDELKFYLKWNTEQGKNYKEKKFWLINELSGKNNLNTNLYLYLCQLISLKILVKENNNENILVICENHFILNCIQDNLNITKKNINVKFLLSKFKFIFKILYSLIYNFLKMTIKFLIIKFVLIFFFRTKNLFDKKTYLIHTGGLNINEDNSIKLNFFPNLNNYINKKFYYIFISQLSFFKKIKNISKFKKNNIIIIEEYISTLEFFISVKNFLKSTFNILNLQNFKDLKIKHLLQFEFYRALSSPSLNNQFWSYFYLIKKIDKKVDEIIIIDHYENMISDQAMICACREPNLKSKIKIIGYNHSLAGNEFLGYYSTKEDWNSIYKPDLIIANGKISKQHLIDRGNLSNKILEGPALRFDKIIKKNLIKTKKIPDKRNVFIPLSQIRDHSSEMIEKIIQLQRLLDDNYFNFYILPHPNSPIDKKLLEEINKKKYPNIYISQLNISDLMDKCSLCISMSTGAVYDAIINGNIVINIGSELNYCDNHLDFCVEKFDFLSTKNLKEVYFLLKSLQSDKNYEEYISKFNQVQKYLIDGMNVVDTDNIKLFQ